MVNPAANRGTFDDPVCERGPCVWTLVRQCKETTSDIEYADHCIHDGEHAAFTLGDLMNTADGLERKGIIFFHSGILT
jgi:hypothetical protein